MIDGSEERVFYIKRHVRSSWKEYLKPLLRLTWPILGARPEWNAILRFRESKIPTMTPVALGESGEKSFLITEGLENCTKLSQLTGCSGQALSNTGQRRIILGEVARIARAMHQAGLHHQDFYLGHLMQLRTEPDRIYVIDLGRARYQKKLSLRWIVKDLAQLDYSAEASSLERLRFLREYLGRPLVRTDKRLIRLISAKRRSIARHSAKNRL
jgi:heptose I phosphotransferase